MNELGSANSDTTLTDKIDKQDDRRDWGGQLIRV